MTRQQKVRRRDFMVGTGSAICAPYFVPSGVLASPGKPGANDRLTVAHIGVGGMGSGHLQRMTKFRAEGKVNIAAVCDVDETRLAKAVEIAGAGVQPGRQIGESDRLGEHPVNDPISPLMAGTTICELAGVNAQARAELGVLDGGNVIHALV